MPPTSTTKASPQPRRIKVDPTDAAGAARLFHQRTGVDLATDPAVEKAASMATLAALFGTVAGLEKWAKPIRQVLRREPDPPTLPEWFADVVAVVHARSVDAPVVAVMTFGTSANVDPGAKVDLVATVTGVVEQVAELRASLATITKTLETVQQLDRELRAMQIDAQGRSGSFVEPNPSNRPADEARLRFARRLDRDWKRAGRPKLGATEIALAAVYVGLDNLSGGMTGLVGRWSAQIRRDKART